jgi:hypothetical protein
VSRDQLRRAMTKAQRRSRLIVCCATVALLGGMAILLVLALLLANSAPIEAIVEATAF